MMSNVLRLTLTFSLLTLLSPLAISQTANNPGNWKTWILPNATSIVVPPPPSGSSTATELAWLKGFQSSADASVASQIKYWDAGAPAYRWVDFVTSRHLANRPIGAPDVNRPYAYVAIAVYDATVAAFNAKYKYNRKRPSEQDPTIIPRVSVPSSPSYPSDYAAAAGAASVVLAYFLPDEADSIQLLAEEAGRSRLSAGVEFPSDYLAGFELGRRVGEQIVARAKADGSGGVFNGTIPTGRCNWTGTNPGNYTAQFWKPFLLTSAREFRPVPPPPVTRPRSRPIWPPSAISPAP